MMKLTKILCVYALTVFFCLSSCVKEPAHIISNGDGEAVMTLTTLVPMADIPQSRAMTSASEQMLQQVKVLAFTSGDIYLYVRDGAVSNVDPHLTNGGGTATIKFTAPISAANVKFVVIANANVEVESVLSTATPNATLKSAILNNALLSKVLAAGIVWNTTSSHYTPIPMHGETTAAPVPQVGATTSVTLTRMLARINVDASATIASFQLSSVRLYNINRGDHIAPSIAPLGTWSYLHIPPYTNPPLLYTLTGTELTNNVLENTIYTFERLGVTSTSPVVLVVGGKYAGSTTETYYRINLMTKGVSPNPDVILSLLRNHSYNVEITSIEGAGYLTPEEAYMAPAVNIDATVQVWDEHEFREIAWDGQRKLGVNRGEFLLASTAWSTAAAGAKNELLIRTDYPGGWTATVWSDLAGTIAVPNDATTGSAWLSLSLSWGMSNTNSRVSLLMPQNTTGANRTAYVHVQAGRLLLVVKVTQEA